MTELARAREAIDRLDGEITRLLTQRLAIVDQISDYKARQGAAVHDPAREARVIERLTTACEADFKEDIALLYQRLFEISRARQLRRRGLDS